MDPQIVRILFAGILFRLIIPLIGMSDSLRARFEVASPSGGLDFITDASLLTQTGAVLAPGTPIAPLLIAFNRLTRASLLTAVALGTVADVITAISLRSVALRTGSSSSTATNAAVIFIWNPLSIFSTASGCADPLKLASAFSAAAAAASAHPFLAGTSMAILTHLGGVFQPQVVLLALPLVSMIMLNVQFKSGTTPWTVLTHQATGLAACTGAWAFTTAGLATGIGNGLALGNLHAGIANLFGLAFGKAFHEPSTTTHNASSAVRWLLPTVYNGYLGNEPWSNLSPNLGAQWYLFAELFPQFRYLFAYAFTALPLALAVGIALRHARQPLVAWCAISLLCGMVGRHPTYSDILLWLATVPLLPSNVLKLIPYKAWFAVGLGTCLITNTAAYEVWLTLGLGNANFLYGMNLAWTGWQALAVLAVLKAANEAEAPPAKSK